jgi:hypothetical protein
MIVSSTIFLPCGGGARFATLRSHINQLVCQADNGRVLGYDNSHDFHHRHFMGKVETIKFKDYETLASRFRDEVQELWRKEDEKDR